MDTKYAYEVLKEEVKMKIFLVDPNLLNGQSCKSL